MATHHADGTVCQHSPDECGIAKPCPEPDCRHVHDHAGCHECGCIVCPTCHHVHGQHEGHEEHHHPTQP